MKNLKILFLFLVIYSTGLQADIIDTRPTKASVLFKIANLNSFPDIAVVNTTNIMPPNLKKVYTLSSNYYSRNIRSAINYVVKSDYLKQQGIRNIDWENDKNVQKLYYTPINKDYSYVEFKTVAFDYDLVKDKNGVYHMHLTKITYKFNCETGTAKPDSVQYFKY